MRIVSDCLVKKKSLLTSRLKSFTKSLEIILVEFLDENCAAFEVGILYN